MNVAFQQRNNIQPPGKSARSCKKTISCNLWLEQHCFCSVWAGNRNWFGKNPLNKAEFVHMIRAVTSTPANSWQEGLDYQIEPNTRGTHHRIDCVTEPVAKQDVKLQKYKFSRFSQFQQTLSPLIEKILIWLQTTSVYFFLIIIVTLFHSCFLCIFCRTLRSAGGISWYWTSCCVTEEASGWVWPPAAFWRWGPTTGPVSSQWNNFLYCWVF